MTDEDRGSEPALLAGRYELGAFLGRGGMGTVRDATDRRLGRSVAVKLLRADLAEQPNARRRFEIEAHAAARLAHPNVVTVFDSGEEHGIPFLVMERLPGRTLADELAGGPLSLERFRVVAREILAALGAAHAAGIIHRDIKPGNVLLTDDSHLKVSDFGIAKTVDDLEQAQTTELIATPGYLAPERLAGETASHQSDLYSVGVLFYEALSGRCPFNGDTPLAVMRAIERGHAEPLTSLQPTVPAGVVAVVERAMALDPRQRFGSAAEMAAALEATPSLDETVAIVTAAASQTVPVDLGSRDGGTRILPLPTPQQVGNQPRAQPIRRRVVTAALAIALVVIAVIGVVSYARGGHTPVSSPAATTPAAPAASIMRATTTTTTTTTAAPPGRGQGSKNGGGKGGKGQGDN